MANCAFSVGDTVERELDGLWYTAEVVDITEVETFHEDGSSTSRCSYDIRYKDDAKVESCVEGEELRMAPFAVGPPSAPRVFPGNISRYKQAQSAALSPPSVDGSVCTRQSRIPSPGPCLNSPAAEEVEGASPPAARSISLEVFRRVLRAVTRPSTAPALQHSRDDHCDRTDRDMCTRHEGGGFSLRRHSFSGTGPAIGAQELPTAINFAPYASRCEVCSKWTVLRCRRCSAAFYCSRACQIEAWMDHSLSCEERKFTPVLEGATILSRHGSVMAASLIKGLPQDKVKPDPPGRSTTRAVGTGTAVGYVSMNPMHVSTAPGPILNDTYTVPHDSPINDHNGTMRPVQLYNGGNNVVEMTSWQQGEQSGRAQPSPTEIEWENAASEIPSAQVVGPRPAFSTPARATASTSTEVSRESSFSAEEAAGLANMLNVRIETAVDALKRNNGDANAAAEWLLSVPSYVAVNSAQVGPEPPQMCGPQPLSYPSNNLRVVEAELDSASKNKSEGNTRDDGEWSDFLELFAGQFSIRGRSCDVLVTQRSAYDFTTTVTIYPKGRAVLRPSVQSYENRTMIRANAVGGVDRTTVSASDLHKSAGADGVPAGFEVDHLPPPTGMDMNEIDDDLYPSGSGAGRAPQDHVLVIQQETLRRLLESDGTNCEALLETTDAANFQRARRILHALEPQYVNPFREICLSSEQQTSTIPIGGVSRFPNYYIMIYKIYESESPPRCLCAQSVRPERVYIQLGTLDATTPSLSPSPTAQTLSDREELFKGSRREPAPIVSTNPFDDEIISQGPYDYAENDMPDLIDVTTGEVASAVIKPEDIQMIADMFGMGRQEAESYLQQAKGSVEAAANMILH